MPPIELFGQTLRRLRKEHGEMSLRDLGEKLGGVSFPYLSQIEAGVATPSEDLVKKIAKLFNMNPEELTFLARDIEAQLREIKEKYPNVAPKFFRKIAREE